MTDQRLIIQIPDDHDVQAVVDEVAAQINRGMTSGYYPTWAIEAVPAEPADLTEPLADSKLIVQMPGRTVHWVVGPEVLGIILTQFVSGLGPAQEGA